MTATAPPGAETPTTAMPVDSIPMDAESRWRDHHMKRQWAQSLLMESMEPVLSRHLRHAIKSVLHFTNNGPEIMDLKGSTQGLGHHWDSFASPMVFPPPRVIPPHSSLSNSIQINHQASTPVTATPTQATPQLPVVASSHAATTTKTTATTATTTTTEHIRIPNTQQRTRSASINSLSQLLEAQLAGEARRRSRDLSTSSRASEVATTAPSVISTTHKSRNVSTSSVTSPTIVVRGFTSTAPTHTRTVMAEEAKSKSTMMVEADDISEIGLGLSESQIQPSTGSSLLNGVATITTVAPPSTNVISALDSQPATLQSFDDHETASHHTAGTQSSTHNSTLGSNNNDSSSSNIIDSLAVQDAVVPSKPRHSRLWSKMRKVVYRETKQEQESPRNTIYLTGTGGDGGVRGGTTSRSMSDTHLSTSSSRPVSTSSTSSYNNIAMLPSFSSSVLSVLSEDQMSVQKELPKTATMGGMSNQMPKVSVAAFETPPETAPNSPTQTLTPTSPTAHSRFGFQHSLPGLARRSSTKSPAAAAEVTAAESRVSQFMYAGQTPRPESTTATPRSRAQSASSSGRVSINTSAAGGLGGQGTPMMDFNLHSDHFSTPNALERSNFKSALKSSAESPDSDSTTPTQLGRSKSASSAQRRETRQHKSPTSQATGAGVMESFPEGEQFLTARRQFREFGVMSPPQESPLKDGVSLDIPRRREGYEELTVPTSPPNLAWSGNITHHSKVASPSPHQQQTSALSPDGRPLSPSQMLSGSSDILPEQSKQDRRKSAISFGGYFSNPSAAANRRTRDLTGHSISGLETDAQGEIIHLRRTSFFDKASPPTLSSLASMIHTNLPSLSQSLGGGSGGTDSPSLSRSPSKSSGLAPEQRTLLQRRPSVAKESTIATTAEADSSKATKIAPRDLKRRITPLRITTPVLLSGVQSLPSPMFPPLSATIPRPLGSSSFAFAPLDRYFFNVDQVHEWNIPTYGRVKFTDHAPIVFHAIRERFHYTQADMDEALSQPMTVMKTPGKSDAIFFASHNHGRFLLKTLRGAEPDNLKGFLSDYLGHIQKYPNTLLPRYLGMYTFEKLTGAKLTSGVTAGAAVGVGDGVGHSAGGIGFGGDRESTGLGGMGAAGVARSKSDATAAQHLHLNGTLLSAGRDDGLPSKVVVVVLANVFDTPEVVHERYDFKGSNVGRRTLPVDGVAIRDSRLVNPIAPELQPRASMEKESGWNDFAHRHYSQLRNHQFATGESRASSMYYEPKSDPIYPGALGGVVGRVATDGGDNGGTTKDISHLTLKEVDFQNRLFTGETQLIHLGSTRKAEVLAQLEEDTSLLRKHGFMDYSMLVGIRIIPKRPIEHEEEEEPQIYSSPESSRRGSLSSRGSDADNSNLDSDIEHDDEHRSSSFHGSFSGSEASRGRRSESQREIEAALGRIWKFISLSDERLVFFKGLGEKAQEAFRDVYSFGEGIVSSGQQATLSSVVIGSEALDASANRATKSGSRKGGKKGYKSRESQPPPPPEVELTAVKSKHNHSRKHIKDRELDVKEVKPRRPLFDDDDNDDSIINDPDSFQTVRYKPRTDSHSFIRPKLSVLIDPSATGTVTAAGKRPSLDTPRHRSMPGGLPILPHSAPLPPAGTAATSRLYSSPPYQQTVFPHHQPEFHAVGRNLQDPTIWAHGVPSLDLPDGYEAVYYFGLIDVLQKYNLVKWLERNIKGANARLMGSGGGGGPSSPMTPGPPASLPLPSMALHPGRSNPSTSSISFASSAFYQLLPHASASEPSLPSVIDPTSASVASAAVSAVAAGAGVQGATATNPALSVLLEDPGSGHGSSSSSSTTTSSQDHLRSNRGSLLLDPNSSYSSISTPISSTRVSQEESTLTVSSPIMIDDTGKALPPPPSTSHSPSPSSTSFLTGNKPRLSTSAPFTKSIGARLSQYSQYSHSSQQSQHSHQSGRSRDSRLSFDIRASNASESMVLPHHLLSSSSSSSPPSSDGAGVGVQIHIPPGQATQATQTQTQTQAQPKPNLHHQYQAPQHAEVSVEEPGRYAERLIDFMRGVLV
ncbi:Phosphatidylinositol 5-phosphate 4-kinase type-2 alpha [Linnemannia gamsii]|uniref:Phosphatidylinositol 5-phosphate 4-kinase type-2 alpha n=1 Tax=Linnemannia gamsii TaxID=64522 RepID=A0ABQ7KGT6_9FUNG|nr:Phosphatidylinositol 5-phosphate 4-kinase type-2 alpha [Linnemannia gamsii]KAG0299050.1 Phosphatidylinositol 5-phosphate 4-kinase type-2 alpha [Linnemannia gamsii]